MIVFQWLRSRWVRLTTCLSRTTRTETATAVLYWYPRYVPAVHRHTRLSLSAAHCPSGGDMNTFPLPHTHSWYTLGNLSSAPLFFEPPMEFCWPVDLTPPLSSPPADVAAAAAARLTGDMVLAVFRPLRNTLAASICIYNTMM